MQEQWTAARLVKPAAMEAHMQHASLEHIRSMQILMKMYAHADLEFGTVASQNAAEMMEQAMTGLELEEYALMESGLPETV